MARSRYSQPFFSTSRPTKSTVLSSGLFLTERARKIQPSIHATSNPDFLFSCLGNFILPSTVLLRRELLDRFGDMSEDPRFRGTEDYELWLRLAPQARFALIDRPLVFYRVRSASLSQDAVSIAQGKYLALQTAIERHPEISLPRPLRGQGKEARRLLMLGQAYLRENRNPAAREAFREALRIHPLSGGAWLWLAIGYLRHSWRLRSRALLYRIV